MKKFMKRKYKVILMLFVLEYACLSLMNKLNIHIQSWIGSAIALRS